MADQAAIGDRATHQQQLDSFQKQIAFLQTVIAVLGAVVIFIFGCGVFWANLNDRFHTYDGYNTRISDLSQQIDILKTNLGTLGAVSSPSYQTEATNDQDAGRCEEGNVVTGVRYDDKEHRLWVRCASLGRAAWNPSGAQARPGQ